MLHYVSLILIVIFTLLISQQVFLKYPQNKKKKYALAGKGMCSDYVHSLWHCVTQSVQHLDLTKITDKKIKVKLFTNHRV